MAIGEAETTIKKERKRPKFKNPGARSARLSAAATQRYSEKLAAVEQAGEKLCNRCKLIKPLTAFQIQKRRNHEGKAYASWCKSCNLQSHDEQRLKDFNITPEEKQRIFVGQKGRCALCDRPESDFQRRLAVDHDHKTGLVRGLLCWYCNKLIAIARDNPERMFRGGLYLMYPPAVAILNEFRFGLPGRTTTSKKRRLKLASKLPDDRMTLVRDRTADAELFMKTLAYIQNPPARKIS
jgi:hypothetical protein